MNHKHKTVVLAKMGMLVAISIVLVAIIHFPIFPAVAFMEYDPADIPILIGTFAFGPVAGIILTVVTSVIQGVTVSAGSGVYGIIMHIIATGVLVIVAGTIYKFNKTRKGAVIALIAGILAMTAAMMSKYDNNTDIHGSTEKCSMGSHAVHRSIQPRQGRCERICDIPALQESVGIPAQIDEQTGRRLHIYRFMLKKPITCGTIIKL